MPKDTIESYEQIEWSGKWGQIKMKIRADEHTIYAEQKRQITPTACKRSNISARVR